MIFLIAGFLLYGNTLGHDFVLDDSIVITDNNFTKQGLSGIDEHLSNDHFTGFYGEEKNLVAGGRYRPLSLIIFSLQYEFFGQNPWVGHFFNILFYILNGFILFLVLKKLFGKNEFYATIPLSLLAALLWFAHPIHTEAVANIKGLDEILSLCFSLLSLYFSLLYFDNRKTYHLIGASLAFLLALLSKESAITWLAAIPISLYYFRKWDTKAVALILLSISSSLAIWFLLRENAIGNRSLFDQAADNLMNDPFLFASPTEKFATIVYTMGKYLQLLVFPHPLTYDYYPKHIPIVDWSHPFVLLSAALIVVLAVIAFIGIRKKKIISFTIFFYAITISVASNILFPIGVFMSERFIYASSIAFCIALGFFILWMGKRIPYQKSAGKFVYSFLTVIVVLYAFKTVSRNRVWENNYTLSTHDANVSVRGAKSNVMAGGTSLERAAETTSPSERQKLINDAVFYLNRAIQIYPEYIDALLLMGNAQWTSTKNAYSAMEYYLRILNINPQHEDAWRNIHIILEKEEDKNRSIVIYEDLLKQYPSQIDVYINLGRLYGQFKNDLKDAIAILEKGRKIEPNNIEILKNLGTAYGMAHNYPAAIEVLTKAAGIRPNDAKIQADLGLSYYFNGNHELAKAAFDKAVRLNPSFDRQNFPI